MASQIVLRLSCDDAPGIVAEVARFLHESGLNIVESAQFFDRRTGRFFMRVVAELLAGPVDLDGLRAGFAPCGGFSTGRCATRRARSGP